MNLELQKGSRSKILAAIIIGIMAIFVVRLFYLQIPFKWPAPAHGMRSEAQGSHENDCTGQVLYARRKGAP